MCGENVNQNLKKVVLRGSPPRVRGKHTGEREYTHKTRITPACAGKTQPVCIIYQALQDHPRVCGENAHGKSAKTRGLGSPPRVRGKPHPAIFNVILKRITPACAGKTTEFPRLPS